MDVRFVSLLCCLGLVIGDPSGCMKINPCKCLMQDGSGVINLAALENMDGFLIRDIKVVRKVDGKKVEQSITFSPCQPFSEPMDLINCSRVAVCVVTRDLQTEEMEPQYMGFGQHEDNEFSYSNESKLLTVTYKPKPGSSFSTIIHFNCSSFTSVRFPLTTGSSDVLEMMVDSPCACPSRCQTGDVGPGNIILVMFAASLTAYLLYGTCSLRSIQTLDGNHITREPKIWCSVCCPLQKPPEPNLADTYDDLDSIDYFKV
ncbi:uncharacterized protein PAF06_000359 [Gastrophryne carolinensis]